MTAEAAKERLVQIMADAYGEKGCADEDEAGSTVYVPSMVAALDALLAHRDDLLTALPLEAREPDPVWVFPVSQEQNT